jgi:hypothetical protein
MRAKKPIKWISDVLETNILGHAMVYVNNKYAGSWIDITNVYSTLQTNNLLYLKAYRRKKTNPRVRTAEENMWRGDKQYLPYMRMMMQQTPTQ